MIGYCPFLLVQKQRSCVVGIFVCKFQEGFVRVVFLVSFVVFVARCCIRKREEDERGKERNQEWNALKNDKQTRGQKDQMKKQKDIMIR
jgi:hypothetical protein